MTYCKYCGMNSRVSTRCEWCKRELTQPVRAVPRPEASQAAQNGESARDAQFTFFIYESLEFPAPSRDILPPLQREEVSLTEILVDFFTYLAAVVFLGSCLIAWRYGNPYLLAAMGCLFLSGMLMGWRKALPAFEKGWDEVGLPLMLMLVVLFPVLLVYLGFIAYGLIKHQTDRTVIRLLSPHFATLAILILVSMIVGGQAVPVRMYGDFRGIELLSLCAVLLGWNASSWRRLLRGY